MRASRVPGFTSAGARRRFLAAYDDALALWPPARSQLVATTFGATHVLRAGPGAGTPVLLLHGSGANATFYYQQANRLARHRPVVAVDGIDDPGRSVASRPLGGLADAAAWLEEVADSLALGRVHLVGHSYGGLLALNHAARHPERVAGVALLDPAGLHAVPRAFYRTLLVGVLARQAPPPLRRALAGPLANATLAVPAQLRAMMRAAAAGFRPPRAPAPPLADADLRRVGAPLLVMLGGRSTLVTPPLLIQRLSGLGLDVRPVVLPRSGHWLPLERPDPVSGPLAEFLAGVDAGSGV